MARIAAGPPILAHLAIQRGGALALHRQIYNALQAAILEGLIRPGQRIPSTRGLAIELGVSRLPVVTAYEQLLHEGYLEGRVGSGTYVSPALPDDLVRAMPRGRAHDQERTTHKDALRARN